VLDPRVQATLLAATQAPSPPGPARRAEAPDGLTEREVEILGLIARGLTNPEIAAQLYLSNHTVKTHINRIFARPARGTGPRPSATRTSTASTSGHAG
jgi:DNA-binding NarL/FixJ family response regulator